METVVSAFQNKLLTPDIMVEVMKNGNLMSPAEKLEAMNGIKDLGSYDNKLQSYRRQLLSDLVRRDPQTAMSAALRTDSGPQSTMDISNTVRSWLMADADAAASWYDTHSASLSPKQRDAAASGYFSMALESDELETARQWMNQFSDPKMKEAASKTLEAMLKKKNPPAPKQ